MRTEKRVDLAAEIAEKLRYGIAKLTKTEIPLRIEYTLEVLWGQRRYKPQIVKRERLKNKEGWFIILTLPPGLSMTDFRKHHHYFEDATDCYIEMEQHSYSVHMRLYHHKLKTHYPYTFDPSEYPKMALPLPIGWSKKGLKVVDLALIPHLLVAGNTRTGKTTFFLNVIAALLQHRHTIFAGIDIKQLDLPHFSHIFPIATTISEAEALLHGLIKHMYERAQIILQAGCQNIQQYHNKGLDLPYIILLIDELGTLLKTGESRDLLHIILQMSAANGIHVIAATQRPSSTLTEKFGDIKALFDARLCYKVADAVNSTMVLRGSDAAAFLPPQARGRGIWQWEETIEIQTMYLDKDTVLSQLKDHQTTRRLLTYEHSSTRLLPR